MSAQSRQLAAIMFTDIVGYTALMGKDEQKAFELLKKNREIQKPIIEQAKSDFDLFKKRAKDQYNYSCHLGILHGWFGNKDEAFRLLNIALAKKNFLMRSIKRDPLFDPLRNDPRFEVLVKKMDFPE